jgi:hypothetical protein
MGAGRPLTLLLLRRSSGRPALYFSKHSSIGLKVKTNGLGSHEGRAGEPHSRGRLQPGREKPR